MDFKNNFVLILMFLNAIILKLRFDSNLDCGEILVHKKYSFLIAFYIGPGEKIRKRQRISVKRQKQLF